MEIRVNKSKLAGFLIDNDRKLRVPRYFVESDLSDRAKEIFKVIADYCLRLERYTIPTVKLSIMLNDMGSDVWDKQFSLKIIELTKNGYIEIIEKPTWGVIA